MPSFCLHPNVYSTGPYKNLMNILEHVWIRNQPVGYGTFYIFSAFANYNGGVRFYDNFRHHIENGGKIVAIFSGSTAQRLTSKQVAKEMVSLGAEVHIINRRRLLHAKCYGVNTKEKKSLVVTSGNFTAPGLNQNVEASVLLTTKEIEEMDFSWDKLINSIFNQNWEIYSDLNDLQNPGWNLLYDEHEAVISLDEEQEKTMVITLGHNDTVRIQARAGTTASRGTQYFWLSKDCYDFFPPLTILNRRGIKTTYSALIKMNYIDIGVTDTECRVTLEAENNVDFRLGTGELRNTRIAKQGDLATITRLKDNEYELRIFRQGTPIFNALGKYAINFIGYKGKRYGYLNNQKFFEIINA